MKRRSVNRRIDRKIFARTSANTKAVNISSYGYRGGVRF